MNPDSLRELFKQSGNDPDGTGAIGESTYSVDHRAAEKIVKELARIGIQSSVGRRIGDATIVNISPEDWHRGSDIVHRVNAGLSAKEYPDSLQAIAVVGVIAGLASVFGVLPVLPVAAAPYIFGAVAVAGIVETIYSAWQAWRQHGRQLPRQLWEDPATHAQRVKSGKITRWFGWGCAAVVVAVIVLFFAAILLANGF